MNLFKYAKVAALLIPLVVTLLLSTYSSAASSAPAQTQLSGTQWELLSLGPTGEQLPVAPSTKLTLVFQEGGDLNGSAGCNNFRGTYTVDGNTMTVSQLASTRRACSDPGLMLQEVRYLAALEKASSLSLDRAGGTLRINYNGGRGTLYFVR